MFQPIVSLDDGAVMGYEALARPEGFASMDSVEPVFEAARTGGQIRDLDWLCRRKAVEEARLLPADKPLFLNISAAALLDPVHGVDQLLLLLSTAGRAPSSVVLEITEHERIRDYDALARVLASYRAEGIRFALDDVGEGHSTLELLAASSSEFLKLGRSLTMTSTKVGSRAAMDATMAFARVSGAVVIAEGVENEFVADLMKAGGITLGQGFGLGKPTMAADVEDVATALADRAALSALRPRSVATLAQLTRELRAYPPLRVPRWSAPPPAPGQAPRARRRLRARTRHRHSRSSARPRLHPLRARGPAARHNAPRACRRRSCSRFP